MSALSPVPASQGVASRMRRQSRKDTEPELLLRRGLHAIGLRYRIHVPVPGKPRRTIDICFPRARVAVFVDGCYWHGCGRHKGVAAHNAEWWARKIAANRLRDSDTTVGLQAAGWTVLRFWEHDLDGPGGAVAVNAVARAARRRDH